MSNLNFEAFNFENLATENPFGEQKTSFVDERFYKLSKDADSRGAAVIRFLPDPEKKLIQQLFKINVNTQKGNEKRWYNEWSPQNIGQADPFHDEWAKHWRAGNKEEARKFSRQERYITNILVEKDPANPENEGKIFLLEMSKSLKQLVEDALMPSKADQALGKQPAQLFNPIRGNSFRLVSKMGSNGFITYEQSGPVDAMTEAFPGKSIEEVVEILKTECTPLSDFLKPEMYKSLEELKEKLAYVKFEDATDVVGTEAASTPKVTTYSNTPKPEVVDNNNSVAPSQNKSQDIDAYLDEIMG